MQEIKCPNCGEVFQVDETVYDKIVKQVRDREFDRELERREELLASKNELEIEKLNARLSAASTEKKLAVNQANSEKERELAEKDILISKLKGEIASKDNENKLKTQALKEQYEEMHKIGVNINQIAKKVNSTGDLYPEEKQELKEMVKELWRILRSSQLK